ncbi:hypothetical protein HDU86_001101 [Geranomyces michiganensis]|nr:hypothetical protein HDU86_001101 [Geranomyces michiganensis]
MGLFLSGGLPRARRCACLLTIATAILLLLLAAGVLQLVAFPFLGPAWTKELRLAVPRTDLVPTGRIRSLLVPSGSAEDKRRRVAAAAAAAARKDANPITPLCLVATWQGSNLPTYSDLFLESLARNAPRVSLHLFVHNTASKPYKLPFGLASAPNFHYVDIATIDPKYNSTGWPGFAADRLCAFFRAHPNPPPDDRFGDRAAWAAAAGASESSAPQPSAAECAELYGLLAPHSGSIMVQLRGAYGQLFEDYVGPDRCAAWAWTDVDTVYGDLGHFLSLPEPGLPLPWVPDVVSLSAGDLHRHYTHGQFTAHMQQDRDRAFAVNRLWRRCSVLRNLPNLIAEYRIDHWKALDEGCYAQAVLQAPLGIHTAILPIQLASWGHQFIDFAASYLVAGNTIVACTLRERADCLRALAPLAARAWLRPFDSLAQYRPKPHPYAGKPVSAIAVSVDVGKQDCGLHYPAQDTVCLRLDWGHPAHDAVRAVRDLASIALSSRKNDVQLLFFEPTPSPGPYLAALLAEMSSSGIIDIQITPAMQPRPDAPPLVEVPQVHFQQWKNEGLNDKRCMEWAAVFGTDDVQQQQQQPVAQRPREGVVVYGANMVIDVSAPCDLP